MEERCGAAITVMSDTPDEQVTFDAILEDDSNNSIPGEAAAGSEDTERCCGRAENDDLATPPTDLPDPESPVVQAAAAVGRTKMRPILRQAGAVDSYTVLHGQSHSTVDAIVENLETVCREGHSVGRVFVDWVRLQLISLASDDTESDYRSIIDRYRVESESASPPRRPVLLFTDAFAELVQGVIQTGSDLYGDIYHRLSQGTDRLGQYFTPHNIATAKADMTDLTGDSPPEYGAGDLSPDAIEARPSIMDPACGSGRLLVAAARAQPHGIYYGVDKDPTCARMAALNLLLCNVDGQIVHGDSLTMDAQTVYTVGHSDSGGHVRIDDPNDISHPLKTP